jgi:hypothetical protein
MTPADWHSLSEWLKSTVPGIITLGAIGSVIAAIVLKLVSMIGRRLFRVALDRFFFFNFRPFSFSALIAYSYVAQGRWADLVIYAVGEFATFVATFTLFWICLLATVIVAIRLGVQAPGLLSTLAAFTGLAFIMLLRNLMSIAGLWAVRFQREHLELRKLLKNKQAFYELTDQIFENLQAPPQAAPPAQQSQPAAAPPSAPPQAPPASPATTPSSEATPSSPNSGA